ncbi:MULTISPECIES: aminotransferase class IV family protein [Micrococcales]|uniref:Branched-chain amino acid aminotransferase n=3 Tax=Micrococcales TaxID=85006 RepID=A0A3Q9NT70_BREAU|nr:MULTISPECIES: aminotransferase class IV family protein [Brevibacterium]AZT94771.1 branched-chain amino acid aminotransferase [Brevibacterium aurantiacum]MDN5715818.1 aminotransferase class IV family protein [Janibacter sp.]
MTLQITHLNGNPATVSDLAPLSFAGYAHFTAMQMRDYSVPGLDLHLARLRQASDTLFGQHLPDERIADYLRTAVEASEATDASVTCFITSRPGEFAPAGESPKLDVLVKVTDPAVAPAGPLALDIVRHERHLSQVKHVGEVSKTFFLRQAIERGFDDAAFEDSAGRLSEATIWNLAFWDGESVIWPEAEYLPGVTMQILARRLHRLGVPQQTRTIHTADLSERLSAVVMNSWTPGIAVSLIGDQSMAQDSKFMRLLNKAYTTENRDRLK